jgi:hypothetical protein
MKSKPTPNVADLPPRVPLALGPDADRDLISRIRETITSRLERRPAEPIDPVAMMERGAVTLEGAAAEYGYSAKKFARLVELGRLPVVQNRDVKRLLIPRAAIVLYLAGRLAFRDELVVTQRCVSRAPRKKARSA